MSCTHKISVAYTQLRKCSASWIAPFGMVKRPQTRKYYLPKPKADIEDARNVCSIVSQDFPIDQVEDAAVTTHVELSRKGLRGKPNLFEICGLECSRDVWIWSCPVGVVQIVGELLASKSRIGSNGLKKISSGMNTLRKCRSTTGLSRTKSSI
jgi:hypothetical protein